MPEETTTVTTIGEVSLVTVCESTSKVLSKQLNELVRTRLAYLIAMREPGIMDALKNGITVEISLD